MESKIYQLQPIPRIIEGFKEDDYVYLSIKIGNGQIGGSHAHLKQEQIAKGNLVQPVFIGSMKKLRNQEIRVETNVVDVNNFTNMCVITTSFLNQENQVCYTKIDQGDAPENGVASFQGTYKLIIMICLFMGSFLSSQDNFAQSSDISYPGLETPSSPGFILLDKAPASIERPTTPQGFGMNVLGLLHGTGGAIEFSPFWLVSHPELTAEQMFQNKFPVAYNFSISAATVKTDTASYLAAGFRTRIFQNYDAHTIRTLHAIKERLELALAELDMDRPDFAIIEELRQDYVSLLGKPSFMVDLAGAFGGHSITNSFGDLRFNRWAIWLSANWRPKGDDFYVSVLGRFLKNEHFQEYADNANLLDLGMRINYDISKFCLSLEYLQRIHLENKGNFDFRLAVVASYTFSENIYLTGTFGKNFSEFNNIIALAGINFGISRAKIKAF